MIFAGAEFDSAIELLLDAQSWHCKAVVCGAEENKHHYSQLNRNKME